MIRGFLTGGLLLFAGCLPKPTVSTGLADPGYTAPTVTVSPDEIPIFRSQRPARPFEEIATVTVYNAIGPEKVARMMREAAADIGGDAIIDAEPKVLGFVFTVVAYREEVAP